jgi:hypothetical protein
MHYMPWYETPSVSGGWGKHWTGHERQHNPDKIKDNGLPDIWFNQHNYFRHDGRPVALMFGPIYANQREQWAGVFDTLEPRPLFFALHHLWKPIGADGGFSWVHREPWTGYPDSATIRQRLHRVFSERTVSPEQLIVSATPGFNDVYVEPLLELDHRDGQTLAESLAVCMDGPWPIVQLVTWNDYGEGTMIEPTHEFGYKFLEIIQESRRKETGAALPFTADDLRLPHRLFNLRKDGASDAATLDAISAALASGDTARARLLLK